MGMHTPFQWQNCATEYWGSGYIHCNQNFEIYAQYFSNTVAPNIIFICNFNFSLVAYVDAAIMKIVPWVLQVFLVHQVLNIVTVEVWNTREML